MNRLIGQLHQELAKSAPAVKLCILLRNQADAIIGKFLGASPKPELNGESLIAAHLAQRSNTFVDVGANSGDWTAMWLSHASSDCRGILFEPSSKAFKRLTNRFEQHSQLALFRRALADTPGTMTLIYHADFDELSTLANRTIQNPRDTLENVEVTTVDIAAPESGFETIDFLKIDAEGFDERVLRGATRYLQEGRIKTLQFEYGGNWADADSTLTAALKFLDDCGYDTFLMRPDGICKFDIRKFGEFFHYSNFVAVRREHLAAVEDLIRPASV
jgi:FkbM family methyltransferase